MQPRVIPPQYNIRLTARQQRLLGLAVDCLAGPGATTASVVRAAIDDHLERLLAGSPDCLAAQLVNDHQDGWP